MLLSGDIETHAQADLDWLRADVLKVPHQGAGTSDGEWLASVESEVAVISVGSNDFGHPVDWVVELLGEHGEVLRTDEDGDVVIDLTIGPARSRLAHGALLGESRRPSDRR
jgi:competence protein ComEC